MQLPLIMDTKYSIFIPRIVVEISHPLGIGRGNEMLIAKSI